VFISAVHASFWAKYILLSLARQNHIQAGSPWKFQLFLNGLDMGVWQV
jgi:hypothetical protein